MSDTWSEYYAVRGRRTGKRAWVLEMCAMQEFVCARWEIVGSPEAEREIRRLAREQAAEMSELIDGRMDLP